jgi:hypothetical protein
MKKNYNLTADGSLIVVESFQQKDLSGGPVETYTRTEIAADQIPKFRRDPDFDAALPPEIKAALGG